MTKIPRRTGQKMLFGIRIILSSCLVCFLSTQVFAQISFDSKEDLENAANGYFEQHDYAKAKPLFSQLLSQDPLDSRYNYRFGVCIMYTEAESLKALPYIEGGANSAGADAEAWFFLGKAYQLNYRFDEAALAYEKCGKAGFNSPGIDLKRSIEECRNGKILYSDAVQFNPESEKKVLTSEFYRPYDFRKLKGKVIPMPPSFKTKFDEKNLSGTFVYTPSNSNVLFYASYGEDDANAKDLYRVRRLPNGEWALPQRLPNIINTAYDEDFGFYDEDSHTLFFSSKGHNTMGGYDIFSSVYDKADDSWSQPINLQYPINSPYDDFLYVSDPSGRMAFFTSSRNSEPGYLRVFKTLLKDQQKVAVSIVQGRFVDQTDSVFNYMSATVSDAASKEVVGEYKSNRLTGKYLLVLPPNKDLILDIGPKEAEGFKFALDVPVGNPTKPFKQQIDYQASESQGTVTVKNFFGGTEEGTPQKFALSRPLKEVEDKMVVMPDREALLAAMAGPEPIVETALISDSTVLAAVTTNAPGTEDNALSTETDKMKDEEQAAKATLGEKAYQDSIHEAELASVKAQEARQQEEQRLARASQQMHADSVNQAKQMALHAKIKEKDRRLKERVKVYNDSIDRTELAFAQQKAMERAKILEDSLRNDKQMKEAIAAEKERLADIGREVEMAKQQAMKDSMEVLREAEIQGAELADMSDQNEILKEMEEQERLLLAEQDSALASKTKEEEGRRKERAKAYNDSIGRAELAVEQQLAIERAKILEDSLRNDKQMKEAISVEKERIANIGREVELAKQRALKDSMEVFREAVIAKLTVDSISSEIPEQVSLTPQQMSEADSTLAENALTDLQQESDRPDGIAEVPEGEKDSTLIAASDEISDQTSDAELFLQTIARLQAQMEEKKQQEAEAAKQGQSEAAILPENLADKQNPNMPKDSTGKSSITEKPVATVAQAAGQDSIGKANTDSLQQLVLLKSYADPNEYLAALNEVERHISEDAASRPDKQYVLRSMDELNGISDTVTQKSDDVALNRIIKADREALAAHEKIAIEKERKLREEMQKDREVVKLYDNDLGRELSAAEIEDIATQSDTIPVDVVSPEMAELTNTSEQPEPDEKLLVDKLDSVETQVLQAEEPVVEPAIADLTPANVDSIVPSEIADAETEEIVSEIEADELIDSLATAKVPEPETLAAEPVKSAGPEEIDTLQEEFAVENLNGEVDNDQPNETLVGDSLIAESVQEHLPAEIVEKTVSEAPVVAPAEAPESMATAGNIHFMKAALHNYASRKPSFNQIPDEDIRNLVQRMRAEDIGRMAVLKTIDNQKANAAGNAAILKAIDRNVRNREVLSHVVKHPAREEIVRPPFDRNDLRQREGVYYKLAFHISAEPMTETVQDAMDPELLINLVVPEFDIRSGHYVTMADARSEYFEFRDRGFSGVQIVPFLKGSPVSPSDLESIPFVE